MEGRNAQLSSAQSMQQLTQRVINADLASRKNRMLNTYGWNMMRTMKVPVMCYVVYVISINKINRNSSA
jgi:hypothetical protein